MKDYFNIFFAVDFHFLVILSDILSFLAIFAADSFERSLTVCIPNAFNWSALFSPIPFICVNSIWGFKEMGSSLLFTWGTSDYILFSISFLVGFSKEVRSFVVSGNIWGISQDCSEVFGLCE